MDFLATSVILLHMRRPIEYIFKGEIQNLFDSFSNLLGIRISFSSFERSELTDFTEYHIGHNRPKCRYCGVVQKKLGLLPKCIESDKVHIKEARETGRLIAYKCHAGMTEAIMPISNSEKVIGFVMIGEIRHAPSLPEHVKEQCSNKKVLEELEKTYTQTKYYSDKEINAIMNIFSSMIKYIIQARLITTKTQDSIAPLLNYMEENPQIDLSLTEAAELLCCSVSSLTQLFKKSTGQTFKQYQIELKLNKADELFENHPQLTVSEVAKKLGFNDPLYFSRTYRKHRGFPPSQRKTYQ